MTGTNERVSVAPNGIQADNRSHSPSISADGRFVAFWSAATNLLGPGGDTNGVVDVYVRHLDAGDPLAADTLLFADGDLDDTVLQVIDATTSITRTLCPAEQVSVAAGNAAFLRPESAAGTANCPGGSRNTDTMLFGGDVARDRPAADGKTGLFKAKDAPAAPSCGGS